MQRAFEAALEAIEPRRLVRSGLRTHTDADLGSRRCGVVAIGKAAGAMTWGAQDALGDALVSGVAVGSSPEPVPEQIAWFTGDHPIPADRSLTAGRAVLRYLDSTDVEFVIFLISGGGSALVEVPPPGVSIEQLGFIQQRALERNVPIEKLNLIRRSTSMVKNGGLLRATRSPSATFLISDVGDRDPDVIASGPTIASPLAPGTVAAVMESAGITIDSTLDEWIRRPQPVMDSPTTVLADGWTAARAAIDSLTDSGLPVSMPRRPFRGEARRVGPAMVLRAETGFTVAPGETTVSVTGEGTGGRNTEAALAVALAIDGHSDQVFGAFATDGVDGPTLSAGAIVDGDSVERVRRAGIDPVGALEANDSYTALSASGDLVVTGPTGTNVADLWMVWADDPVS